jgi:uncharacterized protein (TIGR00266 family)
MSIPDLAQPVEISGQTQKGLSYHILGTIQQTLVADLHPGQELFSNAGSMSWMSTGITMNTNASGGLGGMLKRAFSGASVFVVNYTSSNAAGHIAFSADFPGKILAIDLEAGQSLILHKHAFICAEKSVDFDIFFTRRFFAGAFGGEGFILQKLTGPGAVFVELDGDAIEYHLKAGETLQVEPGHVAMFEESVHFDITTIKGITNVLFGGEGLFISTLTGPGRIWLHSLTPSRMASRIAEYLPGKS